jgi:hypothetical protein
VGSVVIADTAIGTITTSTVGFETVGTHDIIGAKPNLIFTFTNTVIIPQAGFVEIDFPYQIL